MKQYTYKKKKQFHTICLTDYLSAYSIRTIVHTIYLSFGIFSDFLQKNKGFKFIALKKKKSFIRIVYAMFSFD